MQSTNNIYVMLIQGFIPDMSAIARPKFRDCRKEH